MTLFRYLLTGILIFASPISWANSLSSSASLSVNPTDTQDYLREFHRDPRKVMNAPLAHVDENGVVLRSDRSALTSEPVSREAMIRLRDQTREKICLTSGKDCLRRPWQRSQFSEMNKDNQIRAFLYDPIILSRLLDMENQGLLQASPKEMPWSDSFWPQRLGLTGRRWLDPAFPNNLGDFKVNYDYWLSTPPNTLSVNIMSPAEKYDLLVGDANFTLTKSQWNAGASSMKTWGQVPQWAGLCHGWAPAAIMEPNPVRSVIARARNGTSITFYPSDLKALASVSWGESPPPINFVGVRCKVANPPVDEVGRVDSDECMDVNPGTWHMAVVNQLGVKKRGFIFDATYDLQVWNYPLIAYQYRYFNPQTLTVSNHLAGSVVRAENFSIDKFKKRRSRNAKYVVGIAMDITYADPVQPSTNPISSPLKKSVKYVYDLELDATGTIIGGEWYSNWHPDFIWNLPPGGKPFSSGEIQAGGAMVWDGRGPIGDDLHRAALVSSSKGQVLAVVVQSMMNLAKGDPAPTPSPSPPPAR